jgi:hypothetical protein
VRCGRKIGSVIEGSFCRNCDCPVHTECHGDAPDPGAVDGCPDCGAPAEAVAGQQQRTPQEAAPGSTPTGQPAVRALAQPPGCAGLLLGVAFLLLAAVLAAIFAYSRLYGTTPEEELTLVEGLPSNIQHSAVSTRGPTTHYLKFTIGSFATEYSSTRPHYQDVFGAVDSGEPIRVWVSTKRETVFERDGWVPLYKMEHRGRMILDYETTVAHQKEEGDAASFVCPGVAAALGVFSLLLYVRSRLRYRKALFSLPDLGGAQASPPAPGAMLSRPIYSITDLL